MRIIEDDAFFLSPSTLEKVKTHLEGGGLAIFPTETVYGIGCLHSCIPALQKIYDWKGRSFSKPLALLFGTVHRAVEFLCISELSRKVLFHLLPGPLTVMVEKSASVPLPSLLASEGNRTGVRVPDHPLPLSIALLFHIPIALTSANKSGDKEAVFAYEVPQEDHPDILFLHIRQRTPLGIPTTVISVEEEDEAIRVLRWGAYQREQLEAKIKELGLSLAE